MEEIRKRFEALGGEFILPIEEIARKMQRVNCFIFDWDGVFNEGVKFGDQGSPFSETDSMGTNLLRLSYWLQNEETLPVCAIITGAANEGTEYFARREGLHCLVRGFTDKSHAWKLFHDHFAIPGDEVLFVYDDVLDLPIAEKAGLRFQVRINASPEFSRYVRQRHLCDYVTGNPGGRGAVREVCELLLAIQGTYDKVLDVRTEYAEDGYLRYNRARKDVQLKVIKP